MFQRIIPFAIFYFFACSLTGQNLQKVPFDANNLRANAQGRVPCADNSVGGPIQFENSVIGQSNSTPGIGETIYLCFGDSINISDIGAGAMFDGDPNATTQPGVGFAIYDCPPTVDGPNLMTILGDCLIGDPMNEGEVALSIDFDEPFGGSTTFRNIVQANGSSFQDEFNNGDPLQWWFAPITFDVLEGVDGRWESTLGEEGACITVDPAQAFSVVYLNPIEILVNNFPFGGNPCETRLTIVGGLPEFDNTQEYTVEAVNVANPSIRATVTKAGTQNQPYLTNIVASVPGVYEIRISDGRSCEYVEQIDMSACVSREITLESESGTTSIGQEICTPIVVEDFVDIVSLGMHVKWDSSILAFSRFEEGFIKRGDVNLITNTAGDTTGYLGVSYLDFGLIPQTLNDGDTLFTLCFVGTVEGSTPIEFTNSPDFPNNGPPIEVLTADDAGNTVEVGLNPKIGTITVIDPNQLTAVIDEIKDACPNENNGTLEISAFGGEAPYQISISRDGGAFADGPAMNIAEGETVMFSGLAPGKYEYFIQEQSTTIPKFTRDSIEVLSANIGVNIAESSPPTCFGLNDGALIANVLGPNATALTNLEDFDFIWIDNTTGDTLQNQNDQIAENLTAGPYQVVVITNNGCIAGDPGGFLSQPTEMSVSPVPLESSCSGVEDGAIRLTAVMGGNAPYSYEWSNGSTDETNQDIASGEYGYTITDAGGCELQDTFLLNARTELVIRVQNQDNISCFGFDDGAIDISGSQQGTPVNGDYNFAWSPNVTTIDNSVVQSSLVDSLAADSYSVTLTNTGLPAGCQAVQDFVISEPDTLMADQVDITNVSSCSLTNPDGEIAVTFMGGTPFPDGSYEYEWRDTANMNVGATAELTGQPSGLLTLTVTDANGCETTIDTAIGTPPPPEIQFFEGANLACATDVTNLMVTAVPGRAGVIIDEYMWSHDASITGDMAVNVGPDTFTVTVIDSDLCASQATAIVTAPPAIRTTDVAFKPACFATEDGEITVDAAGGSNGMGQGYDFLWSLNGTDLELSSQLTNAAPGTYNLKVTDITGCEFDTLITLGSLPRIVVDFPQADISGVRCFDTPANLCNGEAVVSAGYEGTGDGIFTFTWGATGETIGATNTFNSSSLCAGFQKVSVIDTSGCEMIDSVMIPSPDEILLVSNDLEDVSCFGEGDGAVNIDATGGNGGFTFAWSDGSTDQTRTNLVAGVYDIFILDSDGCTGQGQVEISEPPALLVNIDITQTNDVICEGDANGRITVEVSGGNPGGLNYVWTNNVSTSNSAAGLPPGPYLIDVTDINGCTDQAQYTVANVPPVTAEVAWDPIQCNGFQTGIRVMNVAGGNPGNYTFSVDNSPARPIDETITEFGGERLISLFDAEGCRVDSIYDIEQPRPLEASFVENLVEVDLGSSIELDLDVNGDLPISEIIWSEGGEPVDSSFMCAFTPCDNPTVNPLDNTVYSVLVFDSNDCMAEASITVNVDKNRNVYIPNVFAPNNAGFDTNDRFAVFTGSGVKQINYAKVFNRWGTMVADLTEKRITGASETTEIWDGFIKGEKANQGVYIYIVEIEFIDNTTLLYRGDVALLR